MVEIMKIMAATAAAKSLQSCLTLCSPVPGILQARTLEWVAISSGDLPNPGIEPTGSPALWADVLPSR